MGSSFFDRNDVLQQCGFRKRGVLDALFYLG